MEPVSAALGIASSTVTLAGLALSVGKTLTTVVNTHKQHAALLYSLIGACKAIEVAWSRIHAWIEVHRFEESEEDASFYEQLMGSVDAGQVILGVLQEDLEPHTHVKPGEKSATGTWRALLNETTLRDHCGRLNLQVSSLHLLLATASLLAFLAIVFFADSLIRNRSEPTARKLTCDCLRPVFRKDEESAWTIVATRAASSLHSYSGISRIEGGRRDSMYSERSFAFMNDLLTAPVYKRLALSMLRRPRSSLKKSDVPPSTSIKLVAEHRALEDKSPPGSVDESCSTVNDKCPAIPTTDPVNTLDTELMKLEIGASTEGFSSSVVVDYFHSGFRGSSTSHTGHYFGHIFSRFYRWSPEDIDPSSRPLPQSRWLPLLASVKRGNFTVEEQSDIDKELLNAVERGSLFETAQALDAGADINVAMLPEPCKTPLHVATTKVGCCPFLEFLLSYKNVNLHVLDSEGGNLLHRAVRLRCEHCIQSLLDVGLSMTDEDHNGFSALDFGTKCYRTTRRLEAHVAQHSVIWNGLATNSIIDLNPRALVKACHRKPIRRGHAKVLVFLDGHSWHMSARPRHYSIVS
jgi:hypothetical protein